MGMCAPLFTVFKRKPVTKEEEEKEILRFAERGDANGVNLLLQQDPTIINATNLKAPCHTPLMLAAMKGHVKVARVLVERGADVNLADRDGWTALLYAADRGHGDVVDYLLDRGADQSVASKWGSTALMMASEKGHLSIVEMLLEKGKKEVNNVDNNRRTALWRACSGGHKEVARLLLEAGADFLICSKSGTSPKYMAESKGFQSIVDLIDWWSNEVRQRARDRWANAGTGVSSCSCTLESIAESDDDEEADGRVIRRLGEESWERLPSFEYKSDVDEQ